MARAMLRHIVVTIEDVDDVPVVAGVHSEWAIRVTEGTDETVAGVSGDATEDAAVAADAEVLLTSVLALGPPKVTVNARMVASATELVHVVGNR